MGQDESFSEFYAEKDGNQQRTDKRRISERCPEFKEKGENIRRKRLYKYDDLCLEHLNANPSLEDTEVRFSVVTQSAEAKDFSMFIAQFREKFNLMGRAHCQ